MTPEGDVLVEIEDFVMRRLAEGVPPAAARAPGPPAAAAPAPPPTGSSRRGGGGVPARPLPRPVRPDRRLAAPTSTGRSRRSASGPGSARPRSRGIPGRLPAAEPGHRLLAPADPRPRPSSPRSGKAVLGLDRVGIQDNFFDLGGDSVIGIQIVARATTRGLPFSPEQLFEHQTIAELAAAMSAAQESQAAAAPAAETGPPPLDGGRFRRRPVARGAGEDLLAAGGALLTNAVRPRLRVYHGDEIALGPGKVDLLEAIEKAGTLAGAARRLGMSYMRAWKLLQTMNACFREPLVDTSRGGSGHGKATLTDTGRAALTSTAAWSAKAAQAIDPAWRELLEHLAGFRRPPRYP